MTDTSRAKEEKEKPRRFRRILKRILPILPVAAVVTLAVLYAARKPLFEGWIRGQVRELLLEEAGLEAEIGSIGGNWITNLRLENVRLRGARARLPQIDTLSAEQIEARFDPIALVRSGLKGIHEIRARGLEVSIDLTAEPETAQPAEPSAPAPPVPPEEPGPVTEPEKPEPGKPFHEVFIPPISVSGLDFELRGKDFRVSGRDVGITAGATGPASAEAVLSWNGISVEAKGRCIDLVPAILRLSKDGDTVRFRFFEAAGGKETGSGMVRLPDAIEGATVGFDLSADLSPFGLVRINGGEVSLGKEGGFAGEVELSHVDLEALSVFAKGLPFAPFGLARLKLRAQADRFDLESLQVRGELHLEEAGLAGRVRLKRFDLVDLTLKPGLKGSVSATASWEGGRARLTAWGGIDSPCVVKLAVHADELEPVLPELGGRRLVADLTVEGRSRGGLEDPGFEGNISLSGPDILGVSDVNLEVSGAVDRFRVRLQELRATAREASLTGSFEGALPLGGELSFSMKTRVADAAAACPADIARRYGLAGSMEAEIEGAFTGGTWSGTADLKVRGGAFETFKVDLLEVAADLAQNHLEVMDLLIEGKDRRVQIPYFEAQIDRHGVRGTLPFVEISVRDEALVSTKKVSFSVGEGAFRLSPMELAGDWARLKVAGEMDREGVLSGLVMGEHVLLDRVGALLGLPEKLDGAVSLFFEVEGTSSAPRFKGEIHARSASWAGSPKADVDVFGLAYRDNLLRLEEAEIRTDVGYATLSATLPLLLDRGEDGSPSFADHFMTSGDLRLRMRFRELDPSLFPGMENRAPSGNLTGEVEVEGPLTTPRYSIRTECGKIAIKGAPACELKLALESVEGGVSIRELRVSSRLGRLDLEGFVPLRSGATLTPDGRWRFDPLSASQRFSVRAHFEGMDLARLLEEYEVPKQLRSIRGNGSLIVRLGGTWEDPKLSVDGEVSDIWTPSLGEKGKLTFEAEYEQGSLLLRTLELDLARGFVEAEGRLPMRLGLDAFRAGVPVVAKDAGVEMQVDVRGLQVEPASDLVEGISRTAGRVDGRVEITGPLRDPMVRARIRLSEGVLLFKDLALPSLDSINGSLRLDDREVAFDLAGRTGGGDLIARGGARLNRKRELESIFMDLSGRNRPLLWKGEALRARADLKLRLEGTPEKAELKGSVNVFYTEVDLRQDLGAPGTGAKPLIPGFSIPGLQRVVMDVAISTPEGIRLRSKIHQRGIALADVDVRLRGNLRLKGPTKEPVLTGAVHTDAGKADLPFYSLQLVTGNINFLETNPENPQIHILARTAKGNTLIYVMVNGSLADEPDKLVRFYSEPPMPEEDIRAYLATGVRPDALRGARAGETLGVQIVTLVAKQVSPYVFGKGGGDGLLDRLTISSDRDEEQGTTAYRAEFRLLDWLWLVGERDGYGHYAGRFKLRAGFRSRKNGVAEDGVPPGLVHREKEDKPLPFEIEFLGAPEVSESVMEKAIREDMLRYAEFGRHPSYLDDASYRLRVLHQKKGYHWTEVRVSRQKTPEGATMLFKVEPGPWVQLRKVRFHGASFFKREDLDPFFDTEDLLPGGIGKRSFILREVQGGVSDVESLYRDSGFLWVKVEITDITWNDERDGAKVVLRIDEGPRAVLKTVRIEGVDAPPEALRARIGDPEGKPFSPSMPYHFRNVLLDHFANEGYPFCSVRIEADTDEKRAAVELNVKIDTGPRVRIDNVQLAGNAITVDGVVRFLTGFGEGDLFRARDVREAYTKLMRSGLFRSVQIRPVRDPDRPDRVDMEVKVKESDDFVFTSAFGAGSYELFTTKHQLLNRNLLGTGRVASITGYLSLGDMPTVLQSALGLGADLTAHDFYEFRAGGVEAVLRDRWVLNTPVEAEIKVFIEQRAERSYKIKQGGCELSLRVPLVEKIVLGLSYEYTYRHTFDVVPGADAGERYTSVSGVKIALSRDGRDDRFNPRWGTLVDLSHMYAGRELGGSLAFDKSVVRACAYVSPLGDFMTLAFGGEGAVIDPKNTWNEATGEYVQEPIPISYRFFRGGDSTVRSFWYQGLGPKNQFGDPLGGEAYIQFNVELRINVAKWAGLAFFFEGGSLKRNAAWWLRLTWKEIHEQDRFRYAVGGGIRLNTPIGPLRIDYGHNPLPYPGEDHWALHFSVGHPF